MVPEDFDGDGWIDLWDTDDDNDGHLDTQDDLPFDPRDWIDDDADGIGVNVDTDDDDPTVTTEGEDTADKWSDAEEEECGTLPWSSLSQPEDTDGDGICDAIDEDVDGTVNDTYQCLCAREDDSGNWSRERVFGPLSNGLLYWNSEDVQSGYGFELSSYGTRYFTTYNNDYVSMGMERHDGSVLWTPYAIYGNNQVDYFSTAKQNRITYVATESGIFRYADTNGSSPSVTNVYSHSSTTSSDMAVSLEGDMVARWDSEADEGVIRFASLNGTTFYAEAPGGLRAPDTGGNNQHGQIAFGPGGRLHAVIVNNSSGVIGFYHFYADVQTGSSGEVSSWSPPSSSSRGTRARDGHPGPRTQRRRTTRQTYSTRTGRPTQRCTTRPTSGCPPTMGPRGRPSWSPSPRERTRG